MDQGKGMRSTWARRKASKQAQLISRAIDEQITRDYTKSRKEVKILMMGTDNSLTSTIIQRIQSGSLTEESPPSPVALYKGLADSARNVLLEMKQAKSACARTSTQFGIGEAGPSTQRHEVAVPNVSPCFHTNTARGAPSLRECRTDPRNYVLTQLRRLIGPDLARTWLVGNGISETTINLGSLLIRLVDASEQKSKRRKWMHYFENVTSILFCVDISLYDTRSPEDQRKTCMTQSIRLFESIVNSPWFTRSSVILILNKSDALRAKLLNSPLENYYPEYTGGADADKAADFILHLFTRANGAGLSVFAHLPREGDIYSSVSLIFSAVKDTILLNTLRGTL